MTQSEFKVRVTKDHLVFSAGHFITFNGNICERLHGHNWRTAVEVTGPLDQNYYVFDFIALRDRLQAIVNELDHRVLLPTQHKTISVDANAKEVEARFGDKRWVFPREDCMLMDIENTTAELIAKWIGERLIHDLDLTKSDTISDVQIEVEENFGQWAICKLKLKSN
jgi:6-pyruvoyltetrahydropterin/6-carboxytetrahydropterin synthase